MSATAPNTVVDIARVADLTEEARALMADSKSPEAFVAALVGERLHADAVQFLCHWLPARESLRRLQARFADHGRVRVYQLGSGGWRRLQSSGGVRGRVRHAPPS